MLSLIVGKLINISKIYLNTVVYDLLAYEQYIKYVCNLILCVFFIFSTQILN